MHCALAAAQCIVIGPVCFVGLFVGLLQYVLQYAPSKFWPSRASGKGVYDGAKILAPPYQCASFASLSAFSL